MTSAACSRAARGTVMKCIAIVRSLGAVGSSRFVALALSACGSLPDAFQCTSSMQRTVGGVVGVCEPDGFCSAADMMCPSGQRYVAAGGLDGQCVGPRGGNLGASLCPTFTGLACEGFERASVGSVWDLYLPNATYDQELSWAARGAASGHFHLMPSAALGRTYGELGVSQLPTTGTVATRAFFYFPTAPPYPSSRLLALRQTQSPTSRSASIKTSCCRSTTRSPRRLGPARSACPPDAGSVSSSWSPTAPPAPARSAATSTDRS